MRVKNGKELIRAIEGFCDDMGYRFTDDYSGRFMYGKLCVGFTIPNTNTEKAIMQLTKSLIKDYDLDIEDAGDIATDAMGKGAIIYFPDLQA